MSPRRRKRPVILTVTGIINIVYGCLGLLCGLAGIGGNVFVISMSKQSGQLGQTTREMLAFLDREAPYWMAIDIARAVLILALSVLLIAAGVGLLQQKRWGRLLSMGHEVTIVLVLFATGLYNVLVLMPAQQEFQRTAIAAAPTNNTAQSIGGFAGITLTIVYPIILFVLMVMPGTTAAFARKRRRPRYDDNDDDDDRDERRRFREDDDDRPRVDDEEDMDAHDRAPPRRRREPPDEYRYRNRD